MGAVDYMDVACLGEGGGERDAWISEMMLQQHQHQHVLQGRIGGGEHCAIPRPDYSINHPCNQLPWMQTHSTGSPDSTPIPG